MHILCLSGLAGLLVVGALIDIDCRRLPNWLTSAVAALYGLHVIVSPVPIAWMSASVVASLVFVIGFACFAFQLMGGGDVKLLAALSLWAGIDHLALFLISTSLAGGVLALVMLCLRRLAQAPPLLLLSPLIGLITKKAARPAMVSGHVLSGAPADGSANPSLPYGVAIAAGGFTVIYSLLYH
ncbi:MAG: prepilin peptidase [Alphaproteobacteria bacterium]